MDPWLQRMSELRINGQYQLCDLLGRGAFGRVYLGRDTNSGKEVAIKLEHDSLGTFSLEKEIQMYEEFLAPQPGFPLVYWHSYMDEYHIMVFELLGPNLEDLLVYCGGVFSLKTTLMLADQLLCRLEALHLARVVHHDLKPDNILLGIGIRGNLVYITDFGIAIYHQPWYVPTGDEPSPSRARRPLRGTRRFVSVNNHLGIVVIPRDDLESLGYMLVYLMKGRLPWQGLCGSEQTKDDRALEMKRSISVETLCEGLPSTFVRYMNYIKTLNMTDVPNYRYLRGLFRSTFRRSQYKFDNVYDWTILEFERRVAEATQG